MSSPKDPESADGPSSDRDAAIAGLLDQLGHVLELVLARLRDAFAPGAAPRRTRDSGVAAPEDGAFLAYRLRAGRLEPIRHPDIVPHASLIGVEPALERMHANVTAFCDGRPALDMLLYGDRGTGKSTAVRGLLDALAPRGLRLIEGAPETLLELPQVYDLVRDRAERFILYCDDVSFDSDDPSVRRLKAALDGGLEVRPANLLIAVTSNRRHLLAEHMNDNASYARRGDEIHPGETVHERISLSDRFGLSLPFFGFDQPTYLRIVLHHAGQIGLRDRLPDEELERRALRFATARGGRSGRTARHACTAILNELVAESQASATAARPRRRGRRADRPGAN